MKPIAIFRHAKTEGPGYFATFLDQHSIPWKLIAIDQGEAVPERADAYSGLCLMGGPMSVNDPLPWIAQVGMLIREANQKGIPVIGHCLGGQLMSQAFGGVITASPTKEIGWGLARAEDNDSARHWLGEDRGEFGVVTVFQWHGETFSLPSGAQRILTNEYCANQMFTLGPHLAMQCHVEMSPEMISAWCASWASEVHDLDPLPMSVQTPDRMRSEAEARLPFMRRLADRLYSVWLRNVQRI